jgi:RNA recognition motif-containing protein
MGRELYVGNLPYEATESDLRRLFAVAGTVSSIHLITDPVTGRSKGCAYVKMASAADAGEAINSLDGALFEQRLITVSEARPQKPTLPPRGTARGQRRKGSEGNSPGKKRK